MINFETVFNFFHRWLQFLGKEACWVPPECLSMADIQDNVQDITSGQVTSWVMMHENMLQSFMMYQVISTPRIEIIELKLSVCVSVFMPVCTLTTEPFDLWPWFWYGSYICVCFWIHNKKDFEAKRTVEPLHAGGLGSLQNLALISRLPEIFSRCSPIQFFIAP